MVVLTPEHRYIEEDGSREYVAVTDAFASLGIINRHFFTEQATVRGTRVHRAIAAFLQDEPFDLQDEDAPYFESFLEFRRDNFPDNPELEIEKILHDDVYGLAGSVDLVINGSMMVDWKTGGEAVWHPWQLQAYALLSGSTPTLVDVYLKDAPGRNGKRYKTVAQTDYSLALVKSIAMVVNTKARHGIV